ncbi:MAG: hypothetical protein ACHQRM_03150 [Bacteroidia bacterium]
MNIIQEIIGNLSKEEQRHFKLFAQRTNPGESRKDLLLFDYIKESYPDYKEDVIQGKLYGNEDKNSLYRLKNRLMNDVLRSLSLQYTEESEYALLLYQVNLARLFQGRNQNEIAVHFLTRAEKRAAQLEYLDLLDLIYSELIQLSRDTLHINPDIYIRKRKQNSVKLSRVQEIDDILAQLAYQIRTTQNVSGQNYRQLDELRKKVDYLSRTADFKSSTQLRFKVYQSVSRILLRKQDFVALEKYLLKTFVEFQEKKLFNKGNHETKLQMISYLINSLFKNDKFNISLEYTALLKEAMKEYKGLLEEKYLLYYYNSLVINYSFSDLKKAIEILMEARVNPVIKKHPSYIVFIYGNLATLNFENGDFRQALHYLVKLEMDSGFKNLNIGLRLKVQIAELMIRFELGDFDFAEHKMEQIRKEFSVILSTAEYIRQLRMIELIQHLMRSSNPSKDRSLQPLLNKLLKAKDSEEEAKNDLLNYNRWLKSKV